MKIPEYQSSSKRKTDVGISDGKLRLMVLKWNILKAGIRVEEYLKQKRAKHGRILQGSLNWTWKEINPMLRNKRRPVKWATRMVMVYKNFLKKGLHKENILSLLNVNHSRRADDKFREAILGRLK